MALLETETSAQRNGEQNLLEITEMRMSKGMMGITMIEKIKTEEIRARADVANINLRKLDKQD